MGLSVAGSGRMHSGPVSLSFDQILLEFGEIFWKVEAGHEKPPSRLRRRQDLDRIMGLSYAPRPHAVIAILRAQVKGLTAGALPTILSPIGIEDFSIFQISSHDAYRRLAPFFRFVLRETTRRFRRLFEPPFERGTL